MSISTFVGGLSRDFSIFFLVFPRDIGILKIVLPLMEEAALRVVFGWIAFQEACSTVVSVRGV
jgi:hypothetical protein